MKEFSTTTAICLVLGAGLNGYVNPNETQKSIVFDVPEFIYLPLQQVAIAFSPTLYRGDFQRIARSALLGRLYSGDGSALMGSVRMLKH